MKAVIEVDVPDYQIGQEVSIYFKDTMMIKGVVQEQSGDLISRKDAEQMFRNIRSHLKPQDYKSAEEFNTRDLMLLNAEQMIHALPSVTQEPKTGHWIEHEKGFWSCVNKNGEREGWIPDYECSECGSRAWKHKTNYCPNCGARMVGEEDVSQ